MRAKNRIGEVCCLQGKSTRGILKLWRMSVLFLAGLFTLLFPVAYLGGLSESAGEAPKSTKQKSREEFERQQQRSKAAAEQKRLREEKAERMEMEKAIAAAVEKLASDDDSIRWQALYDIQQGARFASAAVPAVIEVLVTTQDYQEQRAAVATLKEIGQPARIALLELMTHQHWYRRVCARAALEAFGENLTDLPSYETLLHWKPDASDRIEEGFIGEDAMEVMGAHSIAGELSSAENEQQLLKLAGLDAWRRSVALCMIQNKTDYFLFLQSRLAKQMAGAAAGYRSACAMKAGTTTCTTFTRIRIRGLMRTCATPSELSPLK